MGKLLQILMADTGLSEFDVLRIIRNAPIRYKTYKIKKRGGGERTISQPARELKALQRALVTQVLSKLPIHPAATAYRQGVSLRVNAAAHAGNGPILKYDFQDFFPSITARDWRTYCQDKNVFDDPEDISASTNILFQRQSGRTFLRLAIGAPSSPCLSNVMMYDFDDRISRLVAEDSVTFTRYADDLTFSAKRTGFLTGVEKTLKTVLREMKSPSLSLNAAKTILATTKYKRVVTGLVLSNAGAVSIGHDRKRKIRAALHHEVCGQLSPEKRVKLAGLLAFVNDVEPSFLARLEAKYGESTIRNLKPARLQRVRFKR